MCCRTGEIADQHDFSSLQNAKVLSALNQLSTIHRRCEITYIDQSAKIKREIISAIAEQLQEQRRKIAMDTSIDEECQLIPDKRFNDKSLSWLEKSVTSLLSEAQKLDNEVKVIDSLRFEALEARHSRIVEANEGTFEWILDHQNDTNTSFMDWISSSHGIYWITGKAGSGKSTLMKYRCNNDYVRQRIRTWAGSKTAYIASFFFWNPGTDMQKSQQGLLQTLLYDILRQSPGLIPQIMPERWNNTWQQRWTLNELMMAFAKLKSLDSPDSLRFVFFIDELDELRG